MFGKRDKKRSFTIDWPHGHRTRSGQRARILGKTQGNYDTLLAVAILQADGTEQVSSYREDGTLLGGGDQASDLVNCERGAWVNVKADDAEEFPWFTGPYPSREAADRMAGPGRIACRKVRIEADGKIVDITDEEPTS